MSTRKKFLGLLAGASTVAVLGVAVAQGVPPDADIANPALGAGQQSALGTPMGETGVPEYEAPVQAAVIVVTPPVVSQAPAPMPAPVAQAEPAPAPAPATTMGAAPAPAAEPVQQVAEAPVPRADRN
ncbi:hypothetical protein [Ramlibacter tataouinensis]|uniref:Uncharacterized protein n=1 Tax=Ramlibacter tataouinensis (strain ATCC BAA-407 / DSM 14655 / LMG 21543 / TTB310) TaxID=365046 RepID=F5Y3Q4_RAMTT|nr:hypothetical protein [Ramlibacter tataouinensis]AEG93711.1 Hypothetical protein Rta_26100 [Ramlibacter tataouinensis TTB310]